jgi:hypothetical protein
MRARKTNKPMTFANEQTTMIGCLQHAAGVLLRHGTGTPERRKAIVWRFFDL